MGKKKRISYNPYAETMEDALRDHTISWSEFLEPIRREWRKEDQRRDHLNADLVKKHDIAHPEKHRDLFDKLIELKSYRPQVSLQDNDWHIPKDAPDWSVTRKDITALAVKSDQIARALFDLLDNPTFIAAIQRVDLDEKYANAYSGLSELTELLAMMASIEGKQGNRPRKDWTRRAAALCRAFWREHKGEEGKRYFNPEKKPKKGKNGDTTTTEPANAFSRWFCDLMKKVANLTSSQCDTALRN